MVRSRNWPDLWWQISKIRDIQVVGIYDLMKRWRFETIRISSVSTAQPQSQKPVFDFDLTWWPDLWWPGVEIFTQGAKFNFKQVLKKWRRCAPSFFPYQRKTGGVGIFCPPSSARVNPRPVRGLMQPPWAFLSWTPHRLEYRAEIFHSLWGIFCATFGTKKWSGQVRSRSYDVIRGTTSDKFQRNREKTQLGVVRLTWMGIVDEIGVNTWLDVTLDIVPHKFQGQLRSPEVIDLGSPHNDK